MNSKIEGLMHNANQVIVDLQKHNSPTADIRNMSQAQLQQVVQEKNQIIEKLLKILDLKESIIKEMTY